MLEKTLSRNTHYVLSILIPIIISAWLGAGIIAMLLACVISWNICRYVESAIIHRYSPRPPKITELLEVTVVYFFCFVMYHFSFYVVDPGSIGSIAYAMQVVGLSMVATAAVSFLYFVGGTYLSIKNYHTREHYWQSARQRR